MAALEERRRKLREENPWIYEEAEKFRQEAARKREEDPRSRPGFIFERSHSRPRVGIFDAIPLDPPLDSA